MSSNETTAKHGGPRPGAGRKPAGARAMTPAERKAAMKARDAAAGVKRIDRTYPQRDKRRVSKLIKEAQDRGQSVVFPWSVKGRITKPGKVRAKHARREAQRRIIAEWYAAKRAHDPEYLRAASRDRQELIGASQSDPNVWLIGPAGNIDWWFDFDTPPDKPRRPCL